MEWAYSIVDRDSADLAPVKNIPGGWNGPIALFDRDPMGITPEDEKQGIWDWTNADVQDGTAMDPAYFVWRADSNDVTGSRFTHDTFNFFPNDESLRVEWEDYRDEPAPESRDELYADFKYAI